jgi:hypothetical protein
MIVKYGQSKISCTVQSTRVMKCFQNANLFSTVISYAHKMFMKSTNGSHYYKLDSVFTECLSNFLPSVFWTERHIPRVIIAFK